MARYAALYTRHNGGIRREQRGAATEYTVTIQPTVVGTKPGVCGSPGGAQTCGPTTVWEQFNATDPICNGNPPNVWGKQETNPCVVKGTGNQNVLNQACSGV